MSIGVSDREVHASTFSGHRRSTSSSDFECPKHSYELFENPSWQQLAQSFQSLAITLIADMVKSESKRPVADKPKRVLACISCQQRKLKCDRVFPCAKCIQAGVNCVPATQRKRRCMPPDIRELSERLKHCENLLRQNNIEVKPFTSSGPATELSSLSEDGDDGRPRIMKEAVTSNQEQPLNLIETISKVMGDPTKADLSGDTLAAATVRYKGQLHPFKRPWSSAGRSQDLLLFGSGEVGAVLTSLHPGQAQIFRLWQIYLDAVEPMLKVIHVPTLQARIVDAASDVANMDPKTETLMFSIYCTSVMVMTEHDCQTLFGSPKTELLKTYQTACRQALANSMALRADNLDSLTALFLYLVSVKPHVHPRSLAAVLATLIRIARRIGIDNESKNAKFSALEAEIRRRLWWSLVVFDHRMCELSDHSTTTLSPTWDCRTPQNLNDFELRPEVKSMPFSSNNYNPSEAIYAVVRSELADFIRHTDFHLDFVNPCLKNTVKIPQRLSDLKNFETSIEEKYLKLCNPEHPLHYMTIWTTRAYLARSRLLAFYAKHSVSSQPQIDAERTETLSISLDMLECDTRLRASPLTIPFRWRIDWYVPGLAYNHILNSLGKKPAQPLAERAWTALSANWTARVSHDPSPDEQNSVFAFSRLVLRAWDIREALPTEQVSTMEPPGIVLDMKERLSNVYQHPIDTQDVSGDIDDETFAMIAQMDPSWYAADFGPIDLFGQPLGDVDMAHFGA